MLFVIGEINVIKMFFILVRERIWSERDKTNLSYNANVNLQTTV